MAHLAGLAMETEMGWGGRKHGRDGETGMGWPSGTRERGTSGAQMQVPYVPGRTDAKSRALPFFLRTDAFGRRPLSLSLPLANRKRNRDCDCDCGVVVSCLVLSC
jgi:hypothetical protein